MAKQQIARRCCRNGWSGRLRHERTREYHSALLVAIWLVLIFLALDCSAACANQATVFVYHRFNDSRYPTTNISSADFRSHLDYLRQKGVAVLSLGQVVERLKGNVPLPKRCAVITVDDAYKSFITDAWPLLQEYGFPATLFVSTDSIGGRDYLSWEEIKRLHKAGVEIGNHSAGHNHMLDRFVGESQADWEARVSQDLAHSQQVFKKHLGSAPALFAYPYGEFSPELSSLIVAAGFVAAFGQQSGVITPGQDLFLLPRFSVTGRFSTLEEFREKLLLQHLPVKVLTTQRPVIETENPPKLRFYLGPGEYNIDSLRCFVPGLNECLITAVAGEKGIYEAEARKPLDGRRSKYTLTASDSTGRDWYWFSQLWVIPRSRTLPDSSLLR